MYRSKYWSHGESHETGNPHPSGIVGLLLNPLSLERDSGLVARFYVPHPRTTNLGSLLLTRGCAPRVRYFAKPPKRLRHLKSPSATDRKGRFDKELPCLDRHELNRSHGRFPASANCCNDASILAKIAINWSCTNRETALENRRVFNGETPGL